MDKIIAYCGLVCTDCPAYIATQDKCKEQAHRLPGSGRREHANRQNHKACDQPTSQPPACFVEYIGVHC
ncbi:MAG: DUF3795 domain-containing protein [Anaerolineales bacterium]|nr:DUF3795 domain-containing protein [Anaerolineales bacterium]